MRVDAPPRQQTKSNVKPSLPIGLIAFEIAAIAGFVALAVLTRATPYFGIDLATARAIQSFNAPWFDFLMWAVGWPGFPPQAMIILGIVTVGIFISGRRREAIYLLAAAAGIAILAQGTKMFLDRPRPSPDLIHVVNPNVDAGRWGYPAGHVADYLAIYGFMFFLAFRSRNRSIVRALVLVLLGALILLVGPSRLYVGEHWFTDVIGGYLLGAAWLAAVIYWYQRRSARLAADAQRASSK